MRKPIPTPLPGALAHPAAMRRATLVRIEKAVFELFTQHDFHQVSLKAVAAHAHVSLQTIYKYFGSKEQLVAYVLDHTLTRLSKRMVEQLKTIENFRDRLSKTLWVMLDHFDKHPKLMGLLTRSIPAAQFQELPVYENPELMSAFLGLLKEGQQQGLLRQHVSSKILLDSFMGILSRVVLMHGLRGTAQPLIYQHSILEEVVWGALAQPS